MSTKSEVRTKCPKCEYIFKPSTKEVQSRAGSSSRRKGASFENRLAKKFAKWWLGDFEFKRTPMSGGSALKEGWDLAGDIATNAPDFPYHLELKNSPGSFSGLHQFYTSPRGSLWKWMNQAETDAPTGKIPMLIFNRYDQPTYCAIQIKWDSFVRDRLFRCNIKFFEFYDANRGVTVVIWSLEDMLSSDPEVWK